MTGAMTATRSTLPALVSLNLTLGTDGRDLVQLRIASSSEVGEVHHRHRGPAGHHHGRTDTTADVTQAVLAAQYAVRPR